MAYKGSTVKTKLGDLKYVFITGDGRNGAMPGEPERMQFMASITAKKDGELHKHFKALVDAEWKRYCEEFKHKGAPKSTGIKDVMEKTKELDEYGAPKTKPTGDVIITFKTNAKWPDGNPQVVKVFDGKGADITTAVHAAQWKIGEGSRGIIHGIAMGNSVGGSHKVSLYLTAVQLAKLVKYEGVEIDVDDIDDSEDIDLDDSVVGISDEDTPEI